MEFRPAESIIGGVAEPFLFDPAFEFDAPHWCDLATEAAGLGGQLALSPGWFDRPHPLHEPRGSFLHDDDDPVPKKRARLKSSAKLGTSSGVAPEKAARAARVQPPSPVSLASTSTVKAIQSPRIGVQRAMPLRDLNPDAAQSPSAPLAVRTQKAMMGRPPLLSPSAKHLLKSKAKHDTEMLSPEVFHDFKIPMPGSGDDDHGVISRRLLDTGYSGRAVRRRDGSSSGASSLSSRCFQSGTGSRRSQASSVGSCVGGPTRGSMFDASPFASKSALPLPSPDARLPDVRAASHRYGRHPTKGPNRIPTRAGSNSRIRNIDRRQQTRTHRCARNIQAQACTHHSYTQAYDQ
eukprot:TRINITY_DN31879_c0_g1_i1.p1 TRINITY_DN31879_c0_g1~~TRINITY_DN31879_c0_g1_i1.p1  ORF type:complete len:349 (-),score=59.39 TRINITY_DN31879_c0_g1_i1:39-1085(-)